jgi:hypothetical protein
MKRVVALVALVAACGGSPVSTTTADPRLAAAVEYAVSADRALDGTRFSGLTPVTVAEVIVTTCSGAGSVVIDVESAVAVVEAPPGDPEDDVILQEVLLTGVGLICPERVAADLTAAYLAAVHTTIASGAGVAIDDPLAVGVGLAACEALDVGTPEDALVTVAAGGFGIEATAGEILAGAIDAAQAVTAGAVLASAATYLCPEHLSRVAEFVAELAARGA